MSLASRGHRGTWRASFSSSYFTSWRAKLSTLRQRELFIVGSERNAKIETVKASVRPSQARPGVGGAGIGAKKRARAAESIELYDIKSLRTRTKRSANWARCWQPFWRRASEFPSAWHTACKKPFFPKSGHRALTENGQSPFRPIARHRYGTDVTYKRSASAARNRQRHQQRKRKTERGRDKKNEQQSVVLKKAVGSRVAVFTRLKAKEGSSGIWAHVVVVVVMMA